MIKTDLKLYSVRDVAQQFRVAPSRIRTIIGHGRIPDARYVGNSWAIKEGSVVLPDPETELSPTEMYAKHGGNITKYIAQCEERGVPARIPPYEWFYPKPPEPRVQQQKLSPTAQDRVWALYETERRSPAKIASFLGLSEKVVKRYINSRLKEAIMSCLICGGSGTLVAENEQFGDLAFPCRECSGTGEAPRE